MKDLMQRVKSFITFDFPLQADYIKAQFAKIHSKNQADLPEWSTTATRQTMISQYWFSIVPGHFAILISVPFIIVYLVHLFGESNFYIFSILIAGLFSYTILYFFHYKPYFSSFFLPRLDTVKEAYEHRETEKLEKCRQAQLSNFSLSLFFYLITVTNKTNSLNCDDYSASLLMRLYGVDAGSLKKNLELILWANKRKNFSERRITELRNRFNETYNYLEELGYLQGIEKLKELELRFFKSEH